MHGRAQGMNGPAHRRGIDPVARLCQRRQAGLEQDGLLGIGFSLRTAFPGHLVGLAGPLFGRGRDQARFFHVGQRRIDHARARRIVAARKRLDLADQFIAVTRRLDDQREQQDLQFRLIEQALAASTAHPATAGAETAPEAAAKSFTATAATASTTAGEAALEIAAVAAERPTLHAETTATAHAARTEAALTMAFATKFTAELFAALAVFATTSATHAAVVMMLHRSLLVSHLHDGLKIYFKSHFART